VVDFSAAGAVGVEKPEEDDEEDDDDDDEAGNDVAVAVVLEVKAIVDVADV
jgi:hypothetical protein